MILIHWTNRAGLLEILDGMQVYEQTSFTADSLYAVDQMHQAPYGLAFDSDNLGYAEMARLPAGTKGVTRREMEIEWRNAMPINLMRSPWRYFVVRDEPRLRVLSRILRSRGYETEHIEIVPVA